MQPYANVAFGIVVGMLAQGWWYSIKVGARLDLIEYRLNEMQNAGKHRPGANGNAH